MIESLLFQIQKFFKINLINKVRFLILDLHRKMFLAVFSHLHGYQDLHCYQISEFFSHLHCYQDLHGYCILEFFPTNTVIRTPRLFGTLEYLSKSIKYELYKYFQAFIRGCGGKTLLVSSRLGFTLCWIVKNSNFAPKSALETYQKIVANQFEPDFFLIVKLLMDFAAIFQLEFQSKVRGHQDFSCLFWVPSAHKS